MSDQKYLGCINGMVLCVDEADSYNIKGRIFHLYQKDPLVFQSYNEMFFKSEKFFNDLGCPRANQSDRDFNGKVISNFALKGMDKMKKDEEILEEHGELGTFIIRVQHRQHSSWQGRVTWLDENKTVYFRSELELMKLIDGALNENQFENDDEN